MPCQNNMENMPATLNTSEKARKYHFFPRKSILVLRKNSTGCLAPYLNLKVSSFEFPVSSFQSSTSHRKLETFLNAQRFTALLTAEDPVEDQSRNEYRGKQVGQQTESERDRKPLDRTGSEDEQDCRRYNGRHVRIHDGDPGVAKTLIHRGRRRFAIA